MIISPFLLLNLNLTVVRRETMWSCHVFTCPFNADHISHALNLQSVSHLTCDAPRTAISSRHASRVTSMINQPTQSRGIG